MAPLAVLVHDVAQLKEESIILQCALASSVIEVEGSCAKVRILEPKAFTRTGDPRNLRIFNGTSSIISR